MKEIIVNHNGKKCTFSTYYVIKDGFFFSTKNFNIENNFEDCIYVIKLGSNVHPKIYYIEKKNNEWIKDKKLIGDFHSLMDFIDDNKPNIICIRGFSKTVMERFISIMNNLKGTNIQPIKIANEITKRDRIKELPQELEKIDGITDNIAVTDYVLGEERHKTRQRVIKKKNLIK